MEFLTLKFQQRVVQVHLDPQEILLVVLEQQGLRGVQAVAVLAEIQMAVALAHQVLGPQVLRLLVGQEVAVREDPEVKMRLQTAVLVVLAEQMALVVVAVAQVNRAEQARNQAHSPQLRETQATVA